MEKTLAKKVGKLAYRLGCEAIDDKRKSEDQSGEFDAYQLGVFYWIGEVKKEISQELYDYLCQEEVKC